LSGMAISLFAAHVRDGADHVEDYRLSMSREMLGALADVEGFISFNIYSSQDPGWWLGVVRWEGIASIQQWRDNETHRKAWSRTTEFYDEFDIQHAVVFRDMFWREGEQQIHDPVDYFRGRSMNMSEPPSFEALYGYPMPEE
jgi:heme-degrading monooxygenase HmoA